MGQGLTRAGGGRRGREDPGELVGRPSVQAGFAASGSQPLPTALPRVLGGRPLLSAVLVKAVGTQDPRTPGASGMEAVNCLRILRVHRIFGENPALGLVHLSAGEDYPLPRSV